MPDEEKDNELDPVTQASSALSDLNERLSSLHARIEQGDDVAEEELEILAMQAVSELEALREQMAEIAGNMTREQMRAHARATMNDEEYEQYLKDKQSLEDYLERKRSKNG